MATWTCDNCTLENANTVLCCEVCERKRPNTNPDVWKCDNCTLDNEKNVTICQTCGHHKASSNNNHNNSINDEDKSDNTWICDHCTLQNAAASLHCSTCQSINPNKKSVIEITYCWEWKGGNQWHEYPQEISNKIETAYFKGTQSINLDLSHAKYVIDLTKLQQINTSSNKTRKIQRVMYEYDPSTDSQNKIKNNKQQTVDDNNKKENVDNNKRILPMTKQTKDDLMELSSEPEHDDKDDEDDVKMKIIDDKESKKGTLLSIFEKEKNEKIPSPIKLRKKKKRKLSDIIKDDEDETPKKKQKLNDNKIKIAGKYSAKHTSDKEIGAVLNKDLIDALWELSMIERNSGNKFKANAYSKACKALRTCGKKINSGKEAQQLNGVGKKIAGKIDELLSTGHLIKLDNLRKDDVVQGINELCQIHGIGPKKAADLVKRYKIFSINELRDALQKDKELLNHQQKIGLKYFEFIDQRIPRDQAKDIGHKVKKVLMEIDDSIIMDICGSYRRGKADCGDVDILLTHPDDKYNEKKHSKKLLGNIVNKLRECGLLVEDLAHGPIKYMGICRYEEEEQSKNELLPKDFKFIIPSFDDDGLMMVDDVEDDNNKNNNKDEKEEKKVYFRRIDLKFINFEFYYANLLYFTGSDRFNVDMRLKANEKHLILNENGIYKMLDEDDHTKKSKKAVIQPKCEKDIFDALGMEYVEPKDRSW